MTSAATETGGAIPSGSLETGRGSSLMSTTGANTLQFKAATAAFLALFWAMCAAWKSYISKIMSTPPTNMVQVVVADADYMSGMQRR